MENNKKELLNYLNKNKSLLKVFAIIMAIGIFLIAMGVIIKNREMPIAKNAEGVNSKDEYCYVNIYDITDSFANYTVDGNVQDKYYLALAEENLVVLIMNDKQYEDIITILDDENYDESAIVRYGMSEEMQFDLKKLVVETYNEMFETDLMTTLNMNDVIIPYVINLKENPNSGSELFNVFGIMALVSGVVVGLIYFSNIMKNKKKVEDISKKYDISQIVLELNSDTKIDLKNVSMAYLDDYMISYGVPADVIKYTDVIWLYVNETRAANNVRTTANIFVETKDKKIRNVSMFTRAGKKNEDEFTKSLDIMIEKCPYALKGYLQDNITAMSSQYIDETIRQIEEKQNTNE